MSSLKAIIEIGQDLFPVKYEIKDAKLIVDRFLPVSMRYPCNYGYIQNTLAPDGDALDVLVISRYPIFPTAQIDIRIIGVLYMSDEAGTDAKIIAVPAKNVDHYYNNINDITDINKDKLAAIKHFFVNYKTLDFGKFSKVENFGNRAAAMDIVKSSIKAN